MILEFGFERSYVCVGAICCCCGHDLGLMVFKLVVVTSRCGSLMVADQLHGMVLGDFSGNSTWSRPLQLSK